MKVEHSVAVKAITHEKLGRHRVFAVDQPFSRQAVVTAVGHKRIFGDVCSISALPPNVDIRRAALAERSLSAAAVVFIVLQCVPVAGTARVGG
jgi:hypothetical protein